MQYRKGSFTAAGSPSAQTITLGFVPDKIIITAQGTDYDAASTITQVLWFTGMASPSALLQTTSTATPVQSYITTNGISTFDTGADFPTTYATITDITQANPGVVTCTQTFSEDDIVTISNVRGMVQVNFNRYKIKDVSGSDFSLYDLNDNPIDTSGFSAYTSGGIANDISITTVDEGGAGFIIGTGCQTASISYVWEAFLETPTGY